MKNITISISEKDLEGLQLKDSTISFPDLVRKITLELAQKALNATLASASKVGLDSLTMAEIDQEIKEVRDAKRNS